MQADFLSITRNRRSILRCLLLILLATGHQPKATEAGNNQQMKKLHIGPSVRFNGIDEKAGWPRPPETHSQECCRHTCPGDSVGRSGGD
jgi:hypothetical protein